MKLSFVVDNHVVDSDDLNLREVDLCHVIPDAPGGAQDHRRTFARTGDNGSLFAPASYPVAFPEFYAVNFYCFRHVHT